VYVEDGDGDLHVGGGTDEPEEVDPTDAPGLDDVDADSGDGDRAES